MVTVNPELGTDLYAFKKPYDTKEVCVKNLELNYNKYFTAAYNNYKGKLSPDKAYCVKGDLVQEILDGNITNKES